MKIKNTNWKNISALVLVLILAVSFAVRIYNINKAPTGVYPDEAVNGMDALKAKDSGNYSWFYPDNNGREGLFINLIAASYELFDVSVLGLKFPSIIFGTLTVLGIFLLTLELFKSYKLALLSSYLSGVSFWLINFSRIGFRAIMLPAVLVFSFYFLFRGIRTKKIWNFAVGGFIFGIGLHTYIAFRISPFILIMIFIALLLTQKKVIRTYWKHVLVFILFALISAAPIVLTFMNHPEYLESRSGSISILSPEVNNGNLIGTFAKSFGLSLVKFNFWGDQNWRHNFPPYPILHPIVGATFIIGLIYFIIDFFKKLFLRFKGKRDDNLIISTFLLSWFFLMLAPEFMTAEGLPHALRAIGTLPVVYIIAAFPFLHLANKWAKNKSQKEFATWFIILVLLFIGTFNVIKYHYFWANSPQQHGSFNANLMQISDYIKALPKDTDKIIIVESMERIPIKLFNQNLPNTHYVYPGEIEDFLKNFSSVNERVFIMPDINNEAIAKIFSSEGELILKEFKDSFNNKFITLKQN